MSKDTDDLVVLYEIYKYSLTVWIERLTAANDAVCPTVVAVARKVFCACVIYTPIDTPCIDKGIAITDNV